MGQCWGFPHLTAAIGDRGRVRSRLTLMNPTERSLLGHWEEIQ